MRMTSGFLPDAGVHALRSPCRTATRQHGCHGWGMATSSRGAGCGAALNGRREDAWARRQHRGIAVHTCGHRLLGCRSRSPAARRRMPRALPAPASPHAAARMHAGHAPAAPPAAAARSRCPGRAPGRAPAASPAPARLHRSKVRPLRRTVTKCLRTVSTRRMAAMADMIPERLCQGERMLNDEAPFAGCSALVVLEEVGRAPPPASSVRGGTLQPVRLTRMCLGCAYARRTYTHLPCGRACAERGACASADHPGVGQRIRARGL